MTPRGSLLLSSLLFLGCAEEAVGGPCGGEVCLAGQRCDPQELECVDDHAPWLKVFVPGDVVTAEAFEVRVEASDDEALTLLAWNDGATRWQPLALVGGEVRFSVPTPVLDAAPMHLVVRAADAQREVKTSADVRVDRVGPVLERVAPALGVISSGSSVRVRLLVRDGSQSLTALRVAGASMVEPRVERELEVPVALPPNSDGVELDIEVSATDGNGNTTTQQWPLRVDNVRPRVRFVETSPRRLEVEARDGSGVQRVRLGLLDAGLVDATRTDAGTYVADLALPPMEADVAFVAEGLDTAGNLSTVVSTAVHVDTLPPTLAIVRPALGVMTNQATLAVEADVQGATEVRASLDGVTVPLVAGPSWTGVVPVAPSDFVTRTLTVVARDAAGNTTTQTRDVVVDTVAPVVRFTAPLPGAMLNASQFRSSDDVAVRWQVLDADSRASTSSVDGMSLSGAMTTLPTENGVQHDVTVIATDRVGNRASSSLRFVVDRVAPSIVSWVPAANARNVEGRVVIQFSEKTIGATSTSDALHAQAGLWDATHTTWSSAVLPPDAVLVGTLDPLTDLAGNPLAATAPRTFHTAAVVPASGTELASGVQRFKAISDADGVLSIGVQDAQGYQLLQVSPTTGVVTSLRFGPASDFALNAWESVDANTLTASHRVGSSALNGGLVSRAVVTDGVVVPLSSTSTGSVLTVPGFGGEADSSATALINGTSYVRGAATVTLKGAPQLLVTQADSSWVGFSTSASAVNWVRFVCSLSPLGAQVCRNVAFSAASAGATDVRAALSPEGACLVSTWTSAGQRFGVFQPLEPCGGGGLSVPAGCVDNAAVPVMTLSNRLSVAPFSGNGQHSLIGAWSDGLLHVGKMSQCGNTFTPIGNALSDPAIAFEPVQLGNKAVLLYTDTSARLKLFVP